jgi:hypothetical protein
MNEVDGERGRHGSFALSFLIQKAFSAGIALLRFV